MEVENFFYIEGVENEEHLKKKLEEKDSIEEIPTTVPSGIVKQFNMEEKDALDWSIKPIKGLKLVIVVKHIKQERIAKREAKKQKSKSRKLH